MSRRYFVPQTATAEILTRVTNMCALCYDELKKGENIYYDMQECHYLCLHCQEAKVLIDEEKSSKESLDQSLGLF